MKRLAVALMLVLFICTPVLASSSYEDGYSLQQDWREYQKSQQGQKDYNLFKVAFYMGYVTGVVDSLNGVAFTTTVGVTVDQNCAVVGKYIDDHPSEWNLEANYLVKKAMMKAFPKNKR